MVISDAENLQYNCNQNLHGLKAFEKQLSATNCFKLQAPSRAVTKGREPGIFPGYYRSGPRLLWYEAKILEREIQNDERWLYNPCETDWKHVIFNNVILRKHAILRSVRFIWFLLFLVLRKNACKKRKAEVDRQRKLDFVFSSSSASR